MSMRSKYSRSKTRRPMRTPKATHLWEPFSRQIMDFMETLEASGLEEREVARACFYADCYGLDKFNGKLPVFLDPECDDWDCVNPEHQRLWEGQ